MDGEQVTEIARLEASFREAEEHERACRETLRAAMIAEPYSRGEEDNADDEWSDAHGVADARWVAWQRAVRGAVSP